jgi:hypothetical protein
LTRRRIAAAAGSARCKSSRSAVEADHSARMGSPLTSHDHRQQPAKAHGFA